VKDGGGNPVGGAAVTATEVTTGEVLVNVTYTDEQGYGSYAFDMSYFQNGWTTGDIVNVTVMTNDSMIGWNESAVNLPPWDGGYIQLDVVVGPIGIPEFPTVIVPVLGMIALVVVFGLHRREETP